MYPVAAMTRHRPGNVSPALVVGSVMAIARRTQRKAACRTAHTRSQILRYQHMRTFLIAFALLVFPLVQSNAVAQGAAAGDPAAGKTLWDGNLTSCKNC